MKTVAVNLLAQAAPAPVAAFSGTELMMIGVPIVSALGGAVAVVFRLLMAAKDKAFADMQAQMTRAFDDMKAQMQRAYEDMKSEKGTYQQLANDATNMMRIAVNKNLVAEGKPVPEPLARVVAEHSSPVTEKGQTTADLATLRAAVTAAALVLGEPARTIDTKREEHAADEDAEAILIAKEKQQALKREERKAAEAGTVDKDHAAVDAIKDALDAKAKPVE